LTTSKPCGDCGKLRLAKGQYRVQWASSAIADLLEAVAFIRREQPTAARRLYTEIERRTKLLRMHPTSGCIVPEFENRYLRELIVPPFRILYRLLPQVRRIEVLAVVHGSRRLPGN
jgi:toxin ParE1/3/4